MWWIFGVSRGGPMRAEIVRILHERPYNANQLSQVLKVDYKTIRYHLNILLRNNVLTSLEEGNIIAYFISDVMEEQYPLFQEICEKLKEDSSC